MLETILIGFGIVATINALSKIGDTHVTHGSDLFGQRYKSEDGPCHRCDGTGKVNGHTCRKCGGSGQYHKRTWYD